MIRSLFVSVCNADRVVEGSGEQWGHEQAQQTANRHHAVAYLDIPLNRAPFRISAHSAGIINSPIPANKLDPPPSPSRVKNTRPNSGNPPATLDRKKSFPASTEAACSGYDSGRYVRAAWKRMNTPGMYSAVAMMGTIQWTLARDVHPKQRQHFSKQPIVVKAMQKHSPKMRRATGINIPKINATRSLSSGASEP